MNLAVQLYAFSKEVIETDLPRVLAELKAVGYDAVEGFPGPFRDYRAELDRLGMRFAAPHVSPAALAEPARLLDYLKTMGSVDVCSSGPIDWNGRSYDDFCATCEFLNSRGRMLRAAGIHLHYHNHEFEFLPVRGSMTAMDLLLQNLDAGAVDLCFDAGWAWRAGVDPAAFLRAHGARVSYVHLRDFAGTVSVALGQGGLALPEVMAAARELPALRWLVVEQDPVSAQPVRDLATSRRYLRETAGL